MHQAPDALQALDTSLAGEVSKAVWPWVLQQRWCPTVSNDPTPAEALVLWELPQPRLSKGAAGCLAWILVLRLSGGSLLQIPLLACPSRLDGRPQAREADVRGEKVAQVSDYNLWDGTLQPQFWMAWAGQATVIKGSRADLMQSAAAVDRLGMEQSNTSVLLTGSSPRLIAKVYRVLHGGVHPEVELPKALTDAQWPGVPALYATSFLPVCADDGSKVQDSEKPMCSAVVSEAVPNATDGFDYFVELARRKADPSEQARLLGSLTGQMHRQLALALGTDSGLTVGSLLERVQKGLNGDATTKPGLSLAIPEELKQSLRSRLTQISVESESELPRQRIHGDLHLGQTLRTEDGSWFIIDFEGEPLKEIEERSEPDVALRDVAGMLRSFDYAWRRAQDDPDTNSWTQQAREAFLEGYNREITLNDTDQNVLQALQIEKALYEVDYEARFRPDYLRVPLSALELLAQ